MSALWILLAPVMLLGAGALGALGLSSRPRLASWVGAGAATAACAVGLATSLWQLSSGTTEVWRAMPGRLPFAAFAIGVDPLTAFFSVPIYLLGGLAAVYGLTYLRAWEGRKSLGAAWFGFDLLLAGMAMVLLARNGVLFLFAWEVMSIAAWGLVSFEHEKPEVRFAGWVYLVVTHASLAALFVLFLVLFRTSGGSVDFTVLGGGSVPVTLLVVLALLGFGAKAGLPPFHVWLPEAHAAAPSHVSAVMSGVVVKIGLYGILRTVLVVGGPPAWLGPFLVVVGLFAALFGIGQALSQRDLKRALAWSTIENVGIIALAMGVAFWGRTAGNDTVAAFGAAAALLHVWNHTLMKGLMFLGAGSVLHGSGTKDIEVLGGLVQRMPVTGGLMTIGAVAIAALPPLNGFASEWLLYLALVGGGAVLPGASGLGFLLVVASLALVGALAAAAFARLMGTVFLGQPRGPQAAHAHEAEPGMLLPMAVLACGCVAVGLLPQVVVRFIDPVVLLVAGAPSTAPVAALASLSGFAAAIWLCVAVVGLGLVWVLRGTPVAADATWGCGYADPTPRMQYTGRAFARLGADSVLPPGLRPDVQAPEPRGLFPGPARFVAAYGDPFLERYLVVLRGWADRFAGIRRLQHGRTHLYIGYMGIVLVIALAWAVAGGGTP